MIQKSVIEILENFKTNILSKIKLILEKDYNLYILESRGRGFYGRDPSKKHSYQNPDLVLTSILSNTGKLTYRLVNPNKNDNIQLVSNFYFNHEYDKYLDAFFRYQVMKKPQRYGLALKYTDEEINNTFSLIETSIYAIRKRLKYFQGESIKENNEIINLSTQLDDIKKGRKNVKLSSFDIEFNPKLKLITFKFSFNEDLINILKESGGFYFNPQNKTWNYSFNDEIMFYDINSLLTKIQDFSVFLGNLYKNNLNVYKRFLDNKLNPNDVMYLTNFINMKDFFSFLDELVMDIRLYKETMPKFVNTILKDIFGLKVDLYPFQLNSIAFHNFNRNSIYIGDEMGTGKTLQSISTMLAKGKLPILVITPSFLKDNFANDIEKFYGDNLSVYVIRSGKDNWRPEFMRKGTDWDNPYESLKEETSGYDILIINYEQLDNYLDELKKVDWRGIIVDEAHFIKNYKAQRTQNVLELFKNLDKRAVKIMMSGTPITNSPNDLLTQLIALDMFKHISSSIDEYRDNYINVKEIRVGNKTIYDYREGKNLIELNNKLRYVGYIRRNKEDVVKELPSIVRIDRYLELPDRTNYEKIEKEMIKYLEEKYGKDYLKTLTPEKLEVLEKLHQSRLLLKESAMQKIEVIDDIYNQLFEENPDRKIVIFGYHKDVVDKLIKKTNDYLKNLSLSLKKNYKSIVLTADVPNDKRQELVNEFTNNPDAKIFIASLEVGSTGLNLQVADTVIFTELTFEPQLILQAEGRIARIGQKSSSINSIFLLGLDTIDEEILSYIMWKANQMSQISTGEYIKPWFKK